MPDEHCSTTVVRQHKQKVSITKPAAITGKWDCYFIVLPFINSVSMTNSVVSLNDATYGASILGTDDDIVGNFGTITAVMVPNGTPWYGVATNALAYNAWANNIVISTGLNDNIPSRIVAGGFEVHDVTPELYKGGSVTVFDNGTDIQTCSFGGMRQLSASAVGTGFGYVGRAPPSTVTEMSRHPDARSWEAREGVYCRLVLDLNRSDFSMGGKGKILAFNSGGSVAPCSNFSAPGGAGAQVVPTTTVNIAGLGVTMCAFAGLDENAVLSLTSLIFTETAPQTNSAELALASPSAPYDPEALRLYRNVSCHLPPGVPVGMNPKGEWWGMVVQGVGKILKAASPVVSSIPEVGVPLSAIAQFAGQALEKKGASLRANAKQTQQKKPATTPSPKINKPPAKKK